MIRGDTLLRIINDPDNAGEGLLYRKFIADSIGSGHFPLWSPHFYCGFPFIGWSHASIFSPIGLVFLVGDYPTAAVLSLVLNICIFTVSSYVLVRAYSVSRVGSFLGAFVSGFAYFALTENNHFIPRLYTTSWAPLFFALLTLFIRRGRTVYLLGGALVFCFQLFSGHLDTISRELLLLVLAGLGILVIYRRPPWLGGRAILGTGTILILGLLLGAIQVLPLFELGVFSIRSSLSSLPAEVAPINIGNYIGSLFLLLINVGAVMIFWGVGPGRARSERKFQVALLLVILSIMFATNLFGVVKLLNYVPVLNRLYNYPMILNIANLVMALLIGWSWDHLQTSRSPSQTARLLAKGALVLGSLYLIFYLFQWRAGAPILEFKDRFVRWHALTGTGLILAGAGILFYARRELSKPAVIGFALFGLILDGYLHHLVIYERHPKESLSALPAYQDFFNQQSNPPDRSINLMPPHLQNSVVIPFQAGVLDRTQTVDAYISVVPLRIYGLLKALAEAEPPPPGPSQPTRYYFYSLKTGGYVNEHSLPLLNLLNLGYLCTYFYNLKYASDYHLAYFLTYPGGPAEPRLAKDYPESYPHPRVVSPLSRPWINSVFITEGDRLRFQLWRSATAPELSPLPIIYQSFLIGPDQGAQLLFSYTPRPEETIPLSQRQFEAPLSDWKGTTNQLVLVTQPLAAWPAPPSRPETRSSGDERNPAPSVAPAFSGGWIDPIIFNPNKYFQRLPLPGIEIYRNPRVLPRAFMVHDYRLLPEASERLQVLTSPDFPSDREVILERKPLPRPRPLNRRTETDFVRFETYQPERVEIATQSPAAGLLFLSDAYFPGWLASVDGRPAPILRADHAFRAVALEPGSHRVTFQYLPVSFQMGLYMTLASWLFTCGVLVTRDARKSGL